MTDNSEQKTDRATRLADYWWWAGDNDEFFTEGPFRTKAAAIGAGFEAFEESFCICRARWMEPRWDAFDAAELWDRLQEHNAECGYDDYFAAGEVDDKMLVDLERRVTSTVAKWAADHGIDQKSRTFGDSIDDATITIDADLASDAFHVACTLGDLARAEAGGDDTNKAAAVKALIETHEMLEVYRKADKARAAETSDLTSVPCPLSSDTAEPAP